MADIGCYDRQDTSTGRQGYCLSMQISVQAEASVFSGLLNTIVIGQFNMVEQIACTEQGTFVECMTPSGHIPRPMVAVFMF
jgi:hypothetical protein